MKKQDEDGKQLIAGNFVDGKSTKPEIKEVIYGNGVTLKEKQKGRETDKAKRLDESC